MMFRLLKNISCYVFSEQNHCFYRKGVDIPLGWGSDKNGKVTSNPSEVLDGGGLLPLGGVESTSGYKGIELLLYLC